jgi:hypothetical protein
MSQILPYSDAVTNTLYALPLLNRETSVAKKRFNCNNGTSFAIGTSNELKIPISGQAIIAANTTNLCFTILNTGSEAAAIDFSPFSLFDKISIEAGLGGTELERCDDPGVFYANLALYTYDQTTLVPMNGKMGTPIEAPAIADGAFKKTGVSIPATTGSVFVSVPLSEVMGIFQKDLPLYGTDGITLVCRTSGSTKGAYVSATNAATVTISTPFVVASMIDAGKDYENELRQLKQSNGEISIVFNTYNRITQSVSASTVNDGQFLINDRSKSALGFFTVARTQADITTETAYSNSSSGFTGYVRHQYFINGNPYPNSAPISTNEEALDETYDTMRNFSRERANAGLMGRTQGYIKTTFASTNVGTSAVASINLCKIAPSDNQQYGTGLNLNTSLQNYLQLSFVPSATTQLMIFTLCQKQLFINASGQITVPP